MDSANSNTVTQPEQEREMVKTSVAFPEDLWYRVKVAAAQHKTTAQQICIDGVELALKRLAKQKVA